MADGGIRVYLDLPEDAILAAAELMTCKRAGVVLDVVCTKKDDDEPDADDDRRKQTRPHY